MATSDYTSNNNKICIDCKIQFPLSDFYRNGKGHATRCKSCYSLKQAIYRSKTKDFIGVKGYVYFVLASEVNRIKIGFTQNKSGKRIIDLKSQSPIDLTLLLFISASSQMEIQLHKRFKEYRHHGEWFEYSGHIRDYIKDNQNKNLTTI